MKKILCVTLAFLLLSGCTRDYTKADVDKVLKRSRIKAEFVSQETDGDDTIWTYTDKKSGVNFRMIEHWYTAGIDGTNWDASQLLNEYMFLMTDTYIREIPVTAEINREYHPQYPDFLTGYELIYDFETEEDLKQKVKECNAAAKALRKKNKNCAFTVTFCQKDFVYSTNIDRTNRKIHCKDILKKGVKSQGHMFMVSDHSI